MRTRRRWKVEGSTFFFPHIVFFFFFSFSHSFSSSSGNSAVRSDIFTISISRERETPEKLNSRFYIISYVIRQSVFFDQHTYSCIRAYTHQMVPKRKKRKIDEFLFLSIHSLISSSSFFFYSRCSVS